MKSVRKVRGWGLLCLVNLLVVAILGVLLRFKIAWELPFVNYKYLLNAHSHFAFSGWVTTVLFTAFVYVLGHDGRPVRKVYTYQFWLNQVSGYGMLVSFTLQGYGAVAIFFSSLSILFSYWFAWEFGKDLRTTALSIVVKTCMRAALFFLVLSSAGPFLLGYSMSHAVGDLNFYLNAIYLFLHFQYNGWFSFGVFALFFFLADKSGMIMGEKRMRWFVWMMIAACIPAYALSLLWTGPAGWVWVMAAMAGVTQLFALIILGSLLRSISGQGIFSLHPAARAFFLLSLLAFALKVLLQALSVIPFFGQLAFGSRPVIIAYLHLVMLCFVSFFMLGFFIGQGIFSVSTPLQKVGIFCWVAGVVGNEILLLIQSLLALTGRAWSNAVILLFGAALAILVGMLLFVVGQFDRRKAIA